MRCNRGCLVLAAGLMIFAGCGDFLSPQFLGQNGLDPVPAATNIRGFVVVVLNNLTAGVARLTFSADILIPGRDVPQTEDMNMSMGATGAFPMTLPCGVTEITFESLTVSIAGAEPVEVELPTTVVSSPAIQCGSIVSVTVGGIGVGGVRADVQVINN